MTVQTALVAGIVGRDTREDFERVVQECADWAKANCYGQNVVIKIDVVPVWLGFVEEARAAGNVRAPETNKANDELARKMGLGKNPDIIDDPGLSPKDNPEG